MRSECALELDLGYLLGLFGDGESLADLHVRVEDRCYPALRDGPKSGVVFLHRENVIAARDGDPILGAFELRLQCEEILIRLEVGVSLSYCEQPAERATNRGLVLFELMKGLRIRQDVGRK